MRIVRLFSLTLASSALARAAFAGQRNDDAAGAVACAGCGTFMFLMIALFALQIALLVWVARDAKSRGMDSAVVWMLFVFFVPFIGLLVYIFSRPQGAMTRCANCGNNKLQASVKCPHCGNG